MRTVKLKDAMSSVLEGWMSDLPASWTDVLGNVDLGFDAMDSDLELEVWEPIFPVRRGRHFPGQPAGAHMLHAFDDIAPEHVRCVMIGQDPYPEPGFATGRAFEAGNVADWRELDKMFSKSVRVFMQQIVSARTSNAAFSRSFGDWPFAREYLIDHLNAFELPSDIADRWVGEGVLLLNASLTLSRFAVSIDPHQARGHLPLWRPLMLQVVKTMLEQGEPLVLMAFGEAAADILLQAGLTEGRKGRVGVILRQHPAFADAVLKEPNPFTLCNDYLEAMGSKPVAW